MATAPEVDAAGRGTAVLVHGTWGHPADWRWVAAPLEAAGVVVRAPDLPSHADPSTGAGLGEDAAAVRRAIELAGPPTVVVGWSYGAEVISVAAEGLAACSRLVYVSDAPRPAGDAPRDDRWVDDVPLITVTGSTFVLDNDVWPGVVEPPLPDEVVAHLRDHPRRPASRTSASAPQTGAAWRSLPTTVLLGAQDDLLTVEDRHAAAERVADVRVLDCDHFVPWRQPQAVVDVVLEALAGAEPRR
jgi:pimeloyl-ACP methyl ester carboxylesterase